MNPIKIAAAQSSSIRGDIHANIEHHLEFVQLAGENDVDLMVFPELSLTGYELDLAKDLQMSMNDECLFPLIGLSKQYNMTIVVGAPLKSYQDKPYIGFIVICPDKLDVYYKNHLHGTENNYFISGAHHKIVQINGYQVDLAICADITHPEHAKGAFELDANIYASGVLITENGYKADTDLLQSYSQDYGFVSLMTNYCGQSGEFVSAGKSVIYDEHGEMIIQANSDSEVLVVGEKGEEDWQGKIVHLL